MKMAADESSPSEEVKYKYSTPEDQQKPKKKGFLAWLIEFWGRGDQKQKEAEEQSQPHPPQPTPPPPPPEPPSEPKAQFHCLNCYKDLRGACFYCEGDMNYLCWDCVQFNDNGVRVCPNCGGEVKMVAM